MEEKMISSTKNEALQIVENEGDLKTGSAGSVVFYQIMIVIFFLIVAVLFKSIGGELFESCRLKISNMISDRGGYGEIVYPTGAYDGEGEI